MMNYEKYNDIRPLLDEEVPAAVESLINEPMLQQAIASFDTGISWEDMVRVLQSCHTVLDFKKEVSYQLVKLVMSRLCKSVDYTDNGNLEQDKGYTYVSNHRDIILDSAFLNVMLLDEGLKFPEIAIGDNLLVYPWVETLVKLNGSFLVKRNLQGREVLLAAKKLSEYMHDAIADNISLWIAQREGRAKDSSDHTQGALLKMLAMGAPRGTEFVEALRRLNIVPTSCSYEFDPCDYLKAQEMQLKRDCPDYKKTKADDSENMIKGVFGYKGRVHFTTARQLNEILDETDFADMKPADRVEEVARLIDREIYRSYVLFAGNYVALDLLEGTTKYNDKYSEEEKLAFEKYLAERIDLIKLPEALVKDEAFLRERILEMYANPVRNHLSVL